MTDKLSVLPMYEALLSFRTILNLFQQTLACSSSSHYSIACATVGHCYEPALTCLRDLSDTNEHKCMLSVK